jgi:hypothetical protein
MKKSIFFTLLLGISSCLIGFGQGYNLVKQIAGAGKLNEKIHIGNNQYCFNKSKGIFLTQYKELYQTDLTGTILKISNLNGPLADITPYRLGLDSEDNLWVFDNFSKNLYCYDKNFAKTASVSLASSNVIVSTVPFTFDTANNIYIACDDRIIVLNNRGVLVKSIGTLGSGNGQFDANIKHIALDNANNCYVVQDSKVQKFNASGTFLSSFNKELKTLAFNTTDAFTITQDANGTSFLTKINDTGQELSKVAVGNLGQTGLIEVLDNEKAVVSGSYYFEQANFYTYNLSGQLQSSVGIGLGDSQNLNQKIHDFIADESNNLSFWNGSDQLKQLNTSGNVTRSKDLSFLYTFTFPGVGLESVHWSNNNLVYFNQNTLSQFNIGNGSLSQRFKTDIGFNDLSKLEKDRKNNLYYFLNFGVPNNFYKYDSNGMPLEALPLKNTDVVDFSLDTKGNVYVFTSDGSGNISIESFDKTGKVLATVGTGLQKNNRLSSGLVYDDITKVFHWANYNTQSADKSKSYTLVCLDLAGKELYSINSPFATYGYSPRNKSKLKLVGENLYFYDEVTKRIYEISYPRKKLINSTITSTDYTKLATDADFTLSASSNNPSPINYQIISGGQAATLSGNTVKIIRSGEVKIQAYQEATEDHTEAQSILTLTINKVVSTLTIANSTKSVNDPDFSLLASSNSPVAINYQIVSGDALSLSNNTVKILKGGVVNLKAVQDSSSKYLAAVKTFSITINKLANSISTDNALITKQVGDPTFSLKATASSGINTFTYQRTAGTSVEIDASGLVKILAEGTSTIKITQAESDRYLAAEKTIEIKVDKRTLLVQTLSFGTLPKQLYSDAKPFAVEATSDAKLPVNITVISGPAIINGNTLSLTGQAGTIVLEATQSGNTVYGAAIPIRTNITVEAVLGSEKNTLGVTAYPNPVINTLYLSQLPKNASASIVSYTGQNVANFPSLNQGSISLKNIPNGVYKLILKAPKGIQVINIVKR